jgi:chemotaxis response regulator CheB
MGWRVIVQVRGETSHVFDMPFSALLTGLDDMVLPIELIAPGLLAMVSPAAPQ